MAARPVTRRQISYLMFIPSSDHRFLSVDRRSSSLCAEIQRAHASHSFFLDEYLLWVPPHLGTSPILGPNENPLMHLRGLYNKPCGLREFVLPHNGEHLGERAGHARVITRVPSYHVMSWPRFGRSCLTYSIRLVGVGLRITLRNLRR